LPRASQAVRQNQNRSPLPQASPGADRRCIHKALRVTAILLTPLPIALAEPGPATRALPTETVNSGKVGLPPSWRQAGFPV
jgi:hypothetical protein